MNGRRLWLAIGVAAWRWWGDHEIGVFVAVAGTTAVFLIGYSLGWWLS